jgi:outer membrane protein insertion porin family
VRVEVAQGDEGAQVFFTVVEKPRLFLRRVVFEPETEKRKLSLEPDIPIDNVQARRVAAALREQLVAQGHADAEVSAELAPAGFQETDLVLHVDPGPQYQVRTVQFTGEPGVEPDELRSKLQATRSRRLLPGIPGLWKGWILHPAFTEAGIEEDLARLRSFYVSRGHLGARVGLAGAEFEGEDVTLTIEVEAGPRHHVGDIKVESAEVVERVEGLPSGVFPAQALCSCLLEQQRAAEEDGRVDFSARLMVEPAEEVDESERVTLTARIQSGPAYLVERIDFRGHRAFSDATLRRALTLQEGERFDAVELRRSLARLNQLGFLEPVTQNDAQLLTDSDGGRLRLVVTVREKDRGRWLVSGPFGPTSVAGPFQLAVRSRLPAVGRGALELSTYYASLNLLAFTSPAIPALLLAQRRNLLLLPALERPELPGQEWQSGFTLSAQSGWQGIAASYGLGKARRALRESLAEDPAVPGLAVPVVWPKAMDTAFPREPRGALLCRAPRSHWMWARHAGLAALDLVMGSQPF